MLAVVIGNAGRSWYRHANAAPAERLEGADHMTPIESTRSAQAPMARVGGWARSLNLEAQAIILYGIKEDAGAELRDSKDLQLGEFLYLDTLDG